MKNWLRNILIAVPFLVGGLKGFSQNTDNDLGKYLDTAKWKTYDVHQGIKQPEYCDSNVINFLNTSKWDEYNVSESLKQPEYCSKDSVKNKAISFKEAKEKLGIDYITDIKNLGHGYITSKNKGSLEGRSENYEKLKKIQNLKEGVFYEPFEKTLDEVDANNDYIITSKEVNFALEKEKRNAFLKYASIELGVSKDSLVELDKGYVTSKGLEEKLNLLGNIYKKFSGDSIYNIYDIISKDNKVITEDEIVRTARIIKANL
jgi:hypothetical protein